MEPIRFALGNAKSDVVDDRHLHIAEQADTQGDIQHNPDLRIVVDLTDSVFAPREILEADAGLLGASRTMLAIKRFVDVVGVLAAMVIFSPIFLITVLAVKLTSPGPVFHSATRVGKDGKEFVFKKFRSMYQDADQHVDKIAHLNQHDEGPIFKVRRDPRITSVGRIIRGLSIDELPQLMHVLSGKMSLVGPRPPLPKEVTQYDSWEWQRLLVKPGLTCIWQVSGRSDLDFQTWVKMDIEYVKTWSLWNDIVLLARTVPAVLTGRGAY